MGTTSDFLEAEFVDHMLLTGSYTPTGGAWLALSTSTTDDSSGPTEPADTYARQPIVWNPASGRSITQNGEIVFPEAGGAWGTITHYAVMDAVSGGNMLAHGSLNSSIAPVAGNTPTIADAEVVITVSGGACSNYLAPLFLDWAFDGGTLAQPTNLYVAATTVTITDGMTGSTITEVAMTGYSRVNYETWDAYTAGVADNTNTIDFGQFTAGGPETILGTAILDNSSGGNLLFYSNTPNQAVQNNEYVNFQPGEWNVTVD